MARVRRRMPHRRKPRSQTPARRRSAENHGMHRSSGPSQELRHNHRAGRSRYAGGRGPHPGAHRSQRRRQDHRTPRDSRAHALPGRTAGARTRPLERARSAHARCLLHRRCRRAAARDKGLAGARVCRRRASAIRSCQGGRLSGEDHDPARQQDQGIVEGHGDPVAPRPGDGHRREIAGAGRTYPGFGHPVSQAVLRFPAERLLRSQPHHRGSDPPGGRDRARAHRCHVHRPRTHRIQSQHGRAGVALPGSEGASRTGRCGPGAQADARAPGNRWQRPALRSEARWGGSSTTGSSATGSTRRRAHAQHRRLVRCRIDKYVGQSGQPGTRSGQMNTQSNAIPESFDSQRIAPTSLSATEPLYWSIRRELWENRSIYIAPLAVAGVALFGFSLGAIAGIWEEPLRLNPAQPQAPFDMAAGLMMLTGIVVNVFYCLDALHGERRDRSILFWKSLPVSDATTVFAKASIPLVVLLSRAGVRASGQSVAALWTKLSFFRISWLMLYPVLTAHALWPAPIYCWLLLVSGWPRRATFLWAALPVVAIAGVEQIAFHTWHFAAMVGSRLMGAAPTVASTSPDMFPTDPMTHIAPDHFLSTPGLWIGLAVAAVFLAAAVRLRRYREPI